MSGTGPGVPADADGAEVAPPAPAPREVNPPPAQLALATFIMRQVVALVFVVGWLTLFAISLFSGTYTVPFWMHMVGVGVLAYALGINVADLTAFRPPSKADAAVAVGKAVVKRAGE